MLTFEVMATDIRLLRDWSKRTGDIPDPLSAALPNTTAAKKSTSSDRSCLMTDPATRNHPTTLQRSAGVKLE